MLARWFRRTGPIRSAAPDPAPRQDRPPDHLRPLRWLGASLAIVLVATVATAHPMRPPRQAKAVLGKLAAVAVANTRADATEPPPPVTGCQREPPLQQRQLDISTLTELVRMIRQDPTRLGSASIGSPTHGALWGAVRLVASEGIEPTGDQPWGTDVAVRSLERAVREVRSCFDNTPRLSVGDISRERGGWLRPHRSHQSGLDADVGYYYLTGPGWFEPATAANLDRPRTWALVRALVDGGTVESIFMDVSVQRLLRDYAQQLEEDRARLDDVFASSDKRRHDVIVQHARGHLTHFHVRFTDPASVSLGQRLAPILKVHPGAP